MNADLSETNFSYLHHGILRVLCLYVFWVVWEERNRRILESRFKYAWEPWDSGSFFFKK